MCGTNIAFTWTVGRCDAMLHLNDQKVYLQLDNHLLFLVAKICRCFSVTYSPTSLPTLYAAGEIQSGRKGDSCRRSKHKILLSPQSDEFQRVVTGQPWRQPNNYHRVMNRAGVRVLETEHCSSSNARSDRNVVHLHRCNCLTCNFVFRVMLAMS